MFIAIEPHALKALAFDNTIFFLTDQRPTLYRLINFELSVFHTDVSQAG